MGNIEVFNNLRTLIEVLNDGKQGYQLASEVTGHTELKNLFLKFSVQRAEYAKELITHIDQQDDESINEDDAVFDMLCEAWITISQMFIVKNNSAILEAIQMAENMALEKYDRTLADFITHADHIDLLYKQRSGIKLALTEIELYYRRLENSNK